MPGPPPKDPALRQRRNTTATAATLSPQLEPVRPPALPTRPAREVKAGKLKPWHRLTREWWRDVWASPMAPKYTRADKHGLYILAELVDRFWYGDTGQAGEIRLQSARFGLAPVDRWRLQWDVVGDALPRPKAAPPPPPPAPGPDGGSADAAPRQHADDLRKRFLRIAGGKRAS